MFIAAVGAGIIGGIIAYDDHSNYSDHRNYGDAGIVTSLKGKVERLKKMELEAKILRNKVDDQYKDGLAVLEDGALISNGIRELKRSNMGTSNTELAKKLLKEELQEKIEADIAADKKELADLDAIILKINQLQLK